MGTDLKIKQAHEDLVMCAHHLKQPIRNIRSYVEGVLGNGQGQLDARIEWDLTRVILIAARLQAAIQSICAFSDLQLRGNDLAPTPCADVLAEVCASLQASLEENGGTVMADELPTVLADRMLLVLLFQNLIDNALKFRSTEPPRVLVRARRQDDTGR